MKIYESVSSSAKSVDVMGVTLDGQATAMEPGLLELLHVVRRRKKWILGAMALCLLVAIIFTWSARPVYESTATIELNKSGGSLDIGIGDMFGGQLSGGNDLMVDLQTETSILQGDSLALAVIENLHLESQEPFALKRPNPNEEGAEVSLERAPLRRARMIDTFRRNLRVTPERGTRLIRVTYASHDSQQAATIVNAIIENYKIQYLQSHYNAKSEASDWLAKQLTELKQNVEESERKLTDFEKQSGLLSLPSLAGTSNGGSSVHSTVIQKLDMLNTQLTTAEANRIAKEAVYRIVSSGSEDAILGVSQDPLAMQSKSAMFSEGGSLSNLLQLRQQRNQLRISIAQATKVYGDNNRHLQELQTQERAIGEQMRSEVREIIRSAKSDFLLAKQTEDDFRKQFERQQGEASKLNETTVELAILSQEATSKKNLYEDLYSKLQEANVSAGIKATNITVVDPARAVPKPVRPKPRANYFMGLIVGAFLGGVLVFVIESLDNRLTNPQEVERISSIPVIGVIPSFSSNAKQYGYGVKVGSRRRAIRNAGKTEESNKETSDTLWVVSHPASAVAEAIRAVRTSIMLSKPGGGPQVLLITSCMPGEGKSTMSANIAASYAQNGKSVVIVEADMRRPSMRHVLNVEGPRGLSSVLSGACQLEDALIRGIGLDGLDILPAGPRPPLPSELLGAAVFDDLIARLKEKYDVVILDTPPALLLTDAVLMSAKADAVIWIAHAGGVTKQQITRAAQVVKRSNMPIVGFVMNRMSDLSDEYGYGYGYNYRKYGSYYGGEEDRDA